MNIDDCVYEVWNYKYNQFTPCQIIEKVDSKFVRLHCFARVKRGQEEEVVEFDSFTYLEKVKNIGEWGFDILRLFPANTMLQVNGYSVIVDKAEFDEEGNIRLFYKYLECDENKEREIKSNSTAWSWINSYGAQMKKVNPGYNFITLRPDDKIEFRSFLPSHLEEHRKEWYFEDPVHSEVIVYLEKLLGYTRADGKTWMEYFWENTEGLQIAVKLRGDDIVGMDMKDPKNPIQVCSESDVNKFIEKVSEYGKDKIKEPDTVA